MIDSPELLCLVLELWIGARGPSTVRRTSTGLRLNFLVFRAKPSRLRATGAVDMALDGLMKGKRGLIMGVANNRSIAWGVAEALHKAGADLAFTYQGEVFRKRVVPLVEPLKPAALIDCDVSNQGSIDATFAELARVWPSIDFVVHAIGFSDKDQLTGRYIDTTPDNFRMTMDISCYSFTAVAPRAGKKMPHGGAVGTLTYHR